jgi:metallo-beta-lactamase family protein
MEIQFVGAAQTVTGSMHLVRTKHATVLLDCGLYQGKRRVLRAQPAPAVPMTRSPGRGPLPRAHRSLGRAPAAREERLRRAHLRDPATRDLCAVMLRDAAAIQDSDARFLNRHAEREGRATTVEPLYDDDDVIEAIERFFSVPYHHADPDRPGVKLTFIDAGHVLGSAVTVLDVEEDGKCTGASSSPGDLGRNDRPILRDPEVPEGRRAHHREHVRRSPPRRHREDGGRSRRVVNRTYQRGGKLLIPVVRARARAGGDLRPQEAARGAIPAMKVYVDSPLTVKITDVFKLHPECYDAETRALMRGARLALRVRRPARTSRTRGQQGHHRNPGALDRDLRQRHVRGRAHPPPPARAPSRTRRTRC